MLKFVNGRGEFLASFVLLKNGDISIQTQLPVIFVEKLESETVLEENSLCSNTEDSESSESEISTDSDEIFPALENYNTCIESNIYDEEYHGLFSDDFVKQIISNYMAYNFEENTDSNSVLMDDID
jgi:hypothetical protein